MPQIGKLSSKDSGAWRGVAAALLALLTGIGLSRFGYSPLIPALIEAEWFAPAEAAYLGAANFAGYLAGAATGQRLAARFSVAPMLRAAMLLATLAFIACSTPVAFLWFFLWRFASGCAGGVLMVLAAPAVMSLVPAAHRGVAAGAIFLGVGAGVILSGVLTPLLLTQGLPLAWWAYGAISLGATIVAWRWWPDEAAPMRDPEAPVGPSDPERRHAILAVYAAYGLAAIGLVPHMLFLVDFIVRGLERGLVAGGWHWTLFGLGAMAGPVVTGRLGDLIGFRRALQGALMVATLSVGVLVFLAHPLALALSSFIIGGLTPGLSPLVLGRLQEVLPGKGEAGHAWQIATILYAIGQALGGYGVSWLFAASDGGYRLLFAAGATMLFLAFICSLPAGRRAAPP